VQQAVMCVVVKDGRFLLIKRGKGTRMAGYWCHVSGRLEDGETLQQAAERELQEEVGLVGEAMRELAISTTEAEEFALHWFAMKILADCEVTCSEEVDELRWVTIEEYENLTPRFEKNLKLLQSLISAGALAGMLD
jgi:8-oxo-dGTP diphosphatase